MTRVSIFERIATSVPVNKTAAIVAGATDTDADLTTDQLRQNLRTAIWQLEERIRGAAGAEKKRLGKRKMEVQAQLAALGRPRKRRPTYAQNFIQAARETLAPGLYRTICEMAHTRTKEDEAKYGVEEGELQS